jgi:hypothetical protein
MTAADAYRKYLWQAKHASQPASYEGANETNYRRDQATADRIANQGLADCSADGCHYQEN